MGGWMDGWIIDELDGWMDGWSPQDHWSILFFSKFRTELQQLSGPRVFYQKAELQVCLTWGRAGGMDGHSCVLSLPQLHWGAESSVPWEGVAQGCEAVFWTPYRAYAEQILGCLNRASSPYKPGVYLCNTSGLMETRCDQLAWAALECWNTNLDSFYVCSCSAISP